MTQRPNILFILTDQLRASSLPVYGGDQIQTPHIDRLAREGVTLTNAISTCPVCTPYRSMLLTGRHPQTTGHVMNFVRTRHDEIGIGDVFSRAGYRTAWIGKWHLHTGSFPHVGGGKDYVPEGRDRLGFEYWRAYNYHEDYFDGWVHLTDWRAERWRGYETDALNRYVFEFLDGVEDQPFCLFVSPHQPHYTRSKFAPRQYYDRLPACLRLPANVPDTLDRGWIERRRSLAVEFGREDELEARGAPGALRRDSLDMYRHYLAMILALDDMLGALLHYLERMGKADNTLVIFTSDHGTQVGAHGIDPWSKKMPYEESIRVPWVMRYPDVFDGGTARDTLTAPVDILPSLCGLCGIPVPRTVEGHDLSPAWRGIPEALEQNALLTMNFCFRYNHPEDGEEWRGVRAKKYAYHKWLNGEIELFDLEADPLEVRNRAGQQEMKSVEMGLDRTLGQLMSTRSDQLVSGSTYENWFDDYRRIVRNAYGPLGDPEAPPDWSLLA